MNVDKMNQRASALGGDVQWIPLKDGVTTVRVVSRPGEEEPWREVYRHFLQDYVQADDFPRAPVCLGDASCPGCRVAEQLRVTKDDQSANKTKAQRRFIWVALSRDNPYDDNGSLRLKMLECPSTVFLKMSRVAQEWKLDFTDPKDGCDLEILRSSSGGGVPKYDVRAITTLEGNTKTVVRSPLSSEEMALVQGAYPDVDQVCVPPDYRRFAQALGFAVDEPLVQPGAAPQPTTAEPQPAPQPTAAEPQPAPQPTTAEPQSDPQPTTGEPAPQPTTGEPAPTSPTGESEPQPAASPELTCPYFERAYDPEDDSCRECGIAAQCKTGMEAKAGEAEGAPKRRPV